MSEPYPRVTQILRDVGLGADFSRVPQARLEYARMRGEALHLSIRYHHEWTLDEASLHPDVKPGFEAYLRFLADTSHEPIASEIELVHPAWQYIGHPDRVGLMNGGQRVLLDWKFTDSFHFWPAAYQLAAYRMLWNATHPKEPVTQTFAVQFHPSSGKCHLRRIEAEKYEQTFLAALVVWRALQQKEEP